MEWNIEYDLTQDSQAFLGESEVIKYFRKQLFENLGVPKEFYENKEPELKE